MKLITHGCTRIVLLIGNYAIKIPNHSYSHDHFLKGCSANWSERQTTKQFQNHPDINLPVAPTIFSSWFGLISIQKRVQPLLRHLTEEECLQFKNLTTDIKKENFGYLNGELVCVDYA